MLLVGHRNVCRIIFIITITSPRFTIITFPKIVYFLTFGKCFWFKFQVDDHFCLKRTPHTDVTSGVNRTSKVNGNKSLLPVIIYLHGGGFSNMGISMEAYDGSIISALGKVVFVTLNYRVGLFGFFNNELEHLHKEYVANAGLYDQMVAIEWVRKNIQLFGGKCVGGEDTIPLISKFIKGNPNVITLQGQSAGKNNDKCLLKMQIN